jgi:hypothetical protein
MNEISFASPEIAAALRRGKPTNEGELCIRRERNRQRLAVAGFDRQIVAVELLKAERGALPERAVQAGRQHVYPTSGRPGF